jgi:hypothetical protein
LGIHRLRKSLENPAGQPARACHRAPLPGTRRPRPLPRVGGPSGFPVTLSALLLLLSSLLSIALASHPGVLRPTLSTHTTPMCALPSLYLPLPSAQALNTRVMGLSYGPVSSDQRTTEPP